MKTSTAIAAGVLGGLALVFLGSAALNVAYASGYAAAEAKALQRIQDQRLEAVEEREHNAEQEVKTVTEYVEVDRKIYIKGDTIIKEVPVYVTQKQDDACTLPLGFVSVHDRAITAANEAESSTGDPDASSGAAADPLPAPDWAAEPSGVPLSTVLATSAANSAQYNRLAVRFNALAEWSKTQCFVPQ